MAKTLTTRELSAATYGKFSRAGVTVDVRGFLMSSEGQKILQKIHGAASLKSHAKPKNK
jgi:hypothetical protein